VNALGWILFAGCCAVCFAIGWITRGWRQEIAEFREEDRRNAAWDRDYQRGTFVASTRMEEGYVPPSGSLNPVQSGEQQ
jgi:hypothetical protein